MKHYRNEFVALEQMRHVRAIYETAPAPVVATPAMQPAQ